MLLVYRWAAIAWVATIIIGSFLPGKDLPQLSLFQADKIVHLIFYAVLSFLLQKSLTSNFRKNFTVFTMCFFLGTGIEILQPIITPDRRFDIYDIVANSVGCIASISLNRLSLFLNEN